jgi:general secretion pathway protein G
MVIRQRERLRNVRHGFTLMEILIVVAIIVVLASLGGVYLFGALRQSQEDVAIMKAKDIGKAIGMYALNHNGQFPTSLQQLLVQDNNGHGPYLKGQDYLMDPWGQPYQYNQQGPMNNGMEPDVYTISPQTQVKLGNWMTRAR